MSSEGPAARRRRPGRPKRPHHSRENDESPFTRILLEYVSRVPGALGAVLVDLDGEAVDYAGRLAPFDLCSPARTGRSLFASSSRSARGPEIGTPRALSIRSSQRSFIAHALPEQYTLVLQLGRRAGFTAATRAFAVCERALASEAGWPLPSVARSATWFAIQVVANRTGRPTQIRFRDTDYRLEVLGRLAGLGRRETGWRVRLQGFGAELTLVREPGDHWYSDEHIAALFPTVPPPAR